MAHQKQRASYPNTNYVTVKHSKPLIRISSNEKLPDGSVKDCETSNSALKLTIGNTEDHFFVKSGTGEPLNPFINKIIFRANTTSAVTLETEPFEIVI